MKLYGIAANAATQSLEVHIIKRKLIYAIFTVAKETALDLEAAIERRQSSPSKSVKFAAGSSPRIMKANNATGA